MGQPGKLRHDLRPGRKAIAPVPVRRARSLAVVALRQLLGGQRELASGQRIGALGEDVVGPGEQAVVGVERVAVQAGVDRLKVDALIGVGDEFFLERGAFQVFFDGLTPGVVVDRLKLVEQLGLDDLVRDRGGLDAAPGSRGEALLGGSPSLPARSAR